MTIARLSDVGHSYRGRTALDAVTWSVAEGVTGVIGVNGAGKSTLLRVLATELRPRTGQVEVLDRRGRDLAAARERIGVMPQAVPLPEAVRVRNFLAHLAWLRGIARRDRPRHVGEALELVGLVDRAASRIGELSGGMQRRVLFAQAVLAQPALLILDEPTAGLDPEQRVRLREIVAAVPWAAGIVVSSHLMEDLAPIADRVLMLDGGRAVFDGSVSDLAALGAPRGPETGSVSGLEAAFLRLRTEGGS